MKLAAALSLRKSQATEMNNLLKAISNTAYDKESDPNGLVVKYLALTRKHIELINHINKTNSETRLSPSGLTLTDARVRRDILIASAEKLRGLPSRKKDSYGADAQSLVLSSERVIRVADSFSREARELDNLIQETNWLTDLK